MCVCVCECVKLRISCAPHCEDICREIDDIIDIVYCITSGIIHKYCFVFHAVNSCDCVLCLGWEKYDISDIHFSYLLSAEMNSRVCNNKIVLCYLSQY